MDTFESEDRPHNLKVNGNLATGSNCASNTDGGSMCAAAKVSDTMQSGEIVEDPSAQAPSEPNPWWTSNAVSTIFDVLASRSANLLPFGAQSDSPEIIGKSPRLVHTGIDGRRNLEDSFNTGSSALPMSAFGKAQPNPKFMPPTTHLSASRARSESAQLASDHSRHLVRAYDKAWSPGLAQHAEFKHAKWGEDQFCNFDVDTSSLLRYSFEDYYSPLVNSPLLRQLDISNTLNQAVRSYSNFLSGLSMPVRKYTMDPAEMMPRNLREVEEDSSAGEWSQIESEEQTAASEDDTITSGGFHDIISSNASKLGVTKLRNTSSCNDRNPAAEIYLKPWHRSVQRSKKITYPVLQQHRQRFFSAETKHETPPDEGEQDVVRGPPSEDCSKGAQSIESRTSKRNVKPKSRRHARRGGLFGGLSRVHQRMSSRSSNTQPVGDYDLNSNFSKAPSHNVEAGAGTPPFWHNFPWNRRAPESAAGELAVPKAVQEVFDYAILVSKSAEKVFSSLVVPSCPRRYEGGWVPKNPSEYGCKKRKKLQSSRFQPSHTVSTSTGSHGQRNGTNGTPLDSSMPRSIIGRGTVFDPPSYSNGRDLVEPLVYAYLERKAGRRGCQQRTLSDDVYLRANVASRKRTTKLENKTPSNVWSPAVNGLPAMDALPFPAFGILKASLGCPRRMVTGCPKRRTKKNDSKKHRYKRATSLTQ